MTPKSNIHTHTLFADGHNTAEEMVRAAIRLGFHTLGFSEHGHADYDGYSMALDREPAYRAEINRLKLAFKDEIHLLLGCEHDYFSPADLSPYDFVIESVHFIRAMGEYIVLDESRESFLNAVRTHFSGDPYALCREYFRTVAESCENTDAQVIGHMELVMKFNERRDIFDDADPRYLRYAREAVACAAKSGRLVEINTGAVSRGYRTEPYPGRALLTQLREQGGRVILSSDCHDARWIDFGFEQAAELARSCGFRSAWMWRGMEIVEYGL